MDPPEGRGMNYEGEEIHIEVVCQSETQSNSRGKAKAGRRPAPYLPFANCELSQHVSAIASDGSARIQKILRQVKPVKNCTDLDELLPA
jgi:hypothetical protein